VREEELEEVVVEVEDVRESNGRLGRGQTRDGAGTVPVAEPNRPEAARVSRERENRVQREALVGECWRLPGRILAGKKQQQFRPAAARAAGGDGRIASRYERMSARGERRDNAYRREREGGDEPGGPQTALKVRKGPTAATPRSASGFKTSADDYAYSFS
jgi:hypothetical protein